jgi:hypothetical protein
MHTAKLTAILTAKLTDILTVTLAVIHTAKTYCYPYCYTDTARVAELQCKGRVRLNYMLLLHTVLLTKQPF